MEKRTMEVDSAIEIIDIDALEAGVDISFATYPGI